MAEYPYCGPWPTIRLQVLERDEHTCRIQGPRCTTRATHVDHIIPWSEGGAPYDPDNLRAACTACNTGRQQARLAAMAKLNQQTNPEPSRAWY